MKTKYLPFIPVLIIGILISFPILSCNKISEPVSDGHFYFVNKTNKDITFDFESGRSNNDVLKKYAIAPNATTLVRQWQETSETITASSFRSPFVYEFGGYGFVNPMPLTIKFGNDRCLIVGWDSENTPLDIKNYVAEKTGKRAYKFTYTFTEEDYNRATVCQ